MAVFSAMVVEVAWSRWVRWKNHNHNGRSVRKCVDSP